MQLPKDKLNSIITSGIIPDSDSMKGMLSVLTGVDDSNVQ